MQTVDRDARARAEAAWREHHTRLWRAMLAWSGDGDIASDAVAEAFAQALRRGDAVEYVGRWVWRAAFRIAGGLLADRRRTTAEDATALVPAGCDGHAEVAALVLALDQLPAEDRMVVVLSLVGGWPSAEVADLVGSTPGAVRTRLHRARARLRELLEVNDG